MTSPEALTEWNYYAYRPKAVLARRLSAEEWEIEENGHTHRISHNTFAAKYNSHPLKSHPSSTAVIEAAIRREIAGATLQISEMVAEGFQIAERRITEARDSRGS